MLGEGFEKRNGEVTYFCPKPSCSKYISQGVQKMSVNTDTDRFHCWVCGFGGPNLEGVLRLKDRNPDLADYTKALGGTSPVAKKYDEVILPKEFVSMTAKPKGIAWDNARAYLRGRSIGGRDIIRYKIGFCERGPYANRVVFPSFDMHGDINFFIGRGIYPSMLRYNGGTFDTDIVFNEYLMDWKRPVVLTEGVFDAVIAGDNAVPLLGTFVREDSLLFYRIVTGGQPVYFALDDDAMKNQLKLMDSFGSYGVDCLHVDLGNKKDVGSMSREEFAAAKSRALPISGGRLQLLRMKAAI